MRRWRRALGALSVGVMLASTLVAHAGALLPPSGSRAALQVVRRVLAESARIPAKTWIQRGGFYECRGKSGTERGIFAGRPPFSSCRPATLTVEQNLEHGRIRSELDTEAAAGFPVTHQLSDLSGFFSLDPLRGCWRLVAPPLGRQPAVSFNGFHVVTRRRGGVITLLNTRQGVSEVDTVAAGSYRILRNRVLFPTRYGVARLTSTFSYPRAPLALPMVSPLCPGQSPLEITPSRATMVIGSIPSVRVRAIGPVDRTQPLRLWAAPTSAKSYENLWSEKFRGNTVVASVYVSAGQPKNVSDGPPTSNFHTYVTEGTARSRTVLVYVEPQLRVTTTRSNRRGMGIGPYVNAFAIVDVHVMRRYPRPLVYFYNRSPGSRRYRFIAARRLRPYQPGVSGEELLASVRYYDPAAYTVAWCVKHQIVSDMGRPFSNRACGRRFLNRR